MLQGPTFYLLRCVGINVEFIRSLTKDQQEWQMELREAKEAALAEKRKRKMEAANNRPKKRAKDANGYIQRSEKSEDEWDLDADDDVWESIDD